MASGENPYRTAPGSEPPELAGRASKLAAADAALDMGAKGRPAKPIVYTGLRGMGKTALLRTVERRAQARDEATFLRSAPSFDNPDFVDVVVHAYRHAFGLAEGDRHFDADERRLATRPKIHAPEVTLDGRHDPLKPGGTSHHAAMFANLHEHRTIDAGHDLPQESPAAFVDAVLLVRRWSS